MLLCICCNSQYGKPTMHKTDVPKSWLLAKFTSQTRAYNYWLNSTGKQDLG